MMSPLRSHEDLAVASDDVVSASASVLNLAINKKRGTRWKAPDDPHNSGLEVDGAFILERMLSIITPHSTTEEKTWRTVSLIKYPRTSYDPQTKNRITGVVDKFPGKSCG